MNYTLIQNPILKVFAIIQVFTVIIKYAPWQFFMTRLNISSYIDWDILKQSKLRLKLDEFFSNYKQRLFVKLLSEENIWFM